MPSDSATPTLNDQYWFDYSKELVSKGLESRDKAAAAIQSLVVWLWGIYTAFASIGLALSGKELSFANTLFIALASAFLIAVYWSTVWVQMPIMLKFDERSPDDIRQVYNKSVWKKNWRLQFTLFLSVVAACMVSLSLIMASVSKPRLAIAPEKPVAPSLSTAINKRNGETILSINVLVNNAKSVNIEVTPLNPKPKDNSTRIKPNIYMPTENGLVQISLPIDVKLKEVLVSAEWEDPNGIQIQLTKKVTLESIKK